MIRGKTKWLSVFMMASLVLGLSACGGNSPTVSENKDGSDTQQAAPSASTYPDKPISMLVPNGTGGGNDLAARTIAKMSADLGLVTQSMTVENRPGGGQAVGLAEFVTKQKGDYSLFISSPPTIINNLRAEGNSPYGYRDLTPLGRLYNDIAILAVKSDSKYKDLDSFVKDLKADPSKLSIVGGSGPGSQDHLTVMLLADKAGIDPTKVKFVSYDGSAQALTAILGDNGEALSSDLSGIMEYVKAGQVRILAVASEERLDGALKDIPTYKEQGIDLVYYNWKAVFGPKDMSPEAVQFWDKTLKTMTDSDDWNQFVNANGWDPGYLNTADFTTYLEEQEQMLKEILGKLNMLK